MGTHGHSRASEVLLGGVAGELLHSAPCSVLIARPPGVDEAFPNTIVAGADGSPCSAVAVAVARHLSERFDAPLLVVLGSRGMHGVRALGSVSERVAHRAASSVLVVKGPTGG